MNHHVDDLADYLREHIDPLLRVTNHDSERGFTALSLRYSQENLTPLISCIDTYYNVRGFSFCSEASGQLKNAFFSRWYQHISGSQENVLASMNERNISLFVAREETPHQRKVRECIQSLASPLESPPS